MRGTAVDEGDLVDGEVVLQLGVLEQLIEDDLGVGVPFQFHDQAGAATIGLVAQVGDADDDLLADELGDLLHDPIPRHLVRDLGDDDRHLAALRLHDVGDGLHLHRAPPGGQGVLDALRADDVRPGGEVGPFDELGEVLGGRLGMVQGMENGIDHLARGCAAGCWSPSPPRCRWNR